MPSPAMPASPSFTAPAAAVPAKSSASAAALPRHEPLAVQTRDGLVESIHYGSLIATAPDGRVLFSAGEPQASFYPRSSLKPLQAVALVRAGLDLPADLLALTAASHSGAAEHRDGAARILELHGLTAAARANTPTLDWLRSLPSATSLQAHGRAVGMPSDADMGNSEVGHNAIGAGRVFEQGAALVEQAIANGSLFRGETWRWLIAGVRESGEPLHFIGLLSDGNVHSHIDHLLAMLDQAAREGVTRQRVHVLTDGRDVDGRSALRYLDRLEAKLAVLRVAGCDARIASGGGRMLVTMDRYGADWSMVERGWNLHVRGHGPGFPSARVAVEVHYATSTIDDQYLPGFVIVDEHGEPVGPIRDGASVVLFNFRGDRATEMTQAFELDDFDRFDRSPRPAVRFAGMMQYDGDLGLPRHFLVEPPVIRDTMAELLALAGRRQLAIAETHKFGHVTYFWNGNRSEPFDPSRERYVEVPSNLEPLEQRPWMKCAEVTDRLITELRAPYDLVRLNYANGDMVGHTGDLRATILAVEAVDLCLARLVAVTRELHGILLVTADHGNADQMFDGSGEQRRVRTSHSLNPVPLAIFDPREPLGGPTLALPSRLAGLANLAATTLNLLGFEAPDDYEPSLLES